MDKRGQLAVQVDAISIIQILEQPDNAGENDRHWGRHTYCQQMWDCNRSLEGEHGFMVDFHSRQPCDMPRIPPIYARMDILAPVRFIIAWLVLASHPLCEILERST